MEISVILGIVCLVSVAVNVVLLRTALWQSRELANISDNLGDLVEIIENYRNHLRDVYRLDSFYGDETLQSLMTHTNAVRALLEEQYGDVINIYAGTRRRDS